MKFHRKPEEKKSAIIETAEDFFFNKGFDNTSVNMIIGKLKISKGAFYHHFKSKIHLLDSVTEMVVKKELNALNFTFTNTNFSPIEKVNKIMSINKRWEIRTGKIVFNFMKSVYNDENITMRRKIFRKNMSMMAPKINKLIYEGIQTGDFKIEPNELLGEVMININYTVNEEIAYALLNLEISEKNLLNLIGKLKIYETIYDNLLNVESGSVRIFDEESLKKLYFKAK